jgi:diamine N-acetyltransferase
MTSDGATPSADDAADAALAAWIELTADEDAGTGAGVRALPRAVAAGAVVALADVTRDNVREVCRLTVAPAQQLFVAPNAVSLAQALVEPRAWYRVISADDVPVGFVMLSLDPTGGQDGGPEYYLWRLMIADGLQGRGYGRAALSLVVDHVRSLPSASEITVSWVPGEGSPAGFYLGLGFEPTGEIDHGEVVGRLRL